MLKTALVIVVFAGVGSANVIEDFEGFVDTADLNGSITGTTANASASLDSTGGVGGSKGMVFQGNNGVNPFFSVVNLDIPDVSLDGVESIVFSARFLGGSNELLELQLVDEFGGVLIAQQFAGTQSIPTSSFQDFSIDTSGLSAGFSVLRFAYSARDFGTTSVVIDDVRAVVPAAPTVAMAGMGLLAFGRRRR